jgi:hypothetical protein
MRILVGEQISIPVRSNSGFTLSCMNISHEQYGAALNMVLFHCDCPQPMSEPARRPADDEHRQPLAHEGRNMQPVVSLQG